MRRILNLGCGTKTSRADEVINIDWSIYLRLKKLPLIEAFAKLLLAEDRAAKLEELGDNIVVHDLREGIPFEDESVDAVYHSHLLEHLDRDDVDEFMREVKRVLVPGGVHRISCPDFEKLCRDYLDHVDRCRNNDGDDVAEHDEYIADIIEQSVRKEAHGTSGKPTVQRFIENIVLGDARARGETHQWMYDEFNLRNIVKKAGYSEFKVCEFNESQIDGWQEFGLEVDGDGREYKPGSLYTEAVK